MDKNDFVGRDYLTLMDYTADEIRYMLDVSADLKDRLRRREPHAALVGRTAAAIFEKQSTRTRTSFQAACAHLGLQSFYMRPGEMQLSRGEPIKDTARVLDRYCDCLFIRTFGQEIVDEFAAYMENPVINALTDLTHPCQGLADLLTIQEHKGFLEGIKLTYVGDVWNVCQSLMIVGSLLGMRVHVATPSVYRAADRVQAFVDEHAPISGAEIVATDDLEGALRDADVVYGNTFHSMGGPEQDKEQRLRDFADYQINDETIQWAKDDVIFMHCLPGYRGEEMSDSVIEGPHSVVFDQAENRMHSVKAVLYLLLS